MATLRKPSFALTFGKRLRALRVAAGLSQGALAAKIGSVPLAILRYEHGRTIPRADVFCALADALGVEPNALRR